MAEKPKHQVELLGQLSIARSVDRKRLALHVPVTVDGTPNLVRVPLEAYQVDALLNAIGEERAGMKPPRSTDTPADGLGIVIQDPPVHVWAATLNDAPGITLHHPGFGWLEFLLSKESAQHLVQGLQMILAAETPSPSRKN